MASEDPILTEDIREGEEYYEESCSEIPRKDLFEEFRLNNLFCDFLIKVGNKRWNCHRVMLVATSAYFRTLLESAFLESSSGEVEFPEYMSDSMDIILKFMYTGSIKTSVSNVLAVHRAGSYLLINRLVDIICDDFIHRKFELVSKTDGFLSLEWMVLESIIKNEKQQANEQCIWEAVMKWVQHDLENRSKVLPKLMEHVRFDLISPTYLWQNIAEDDLVKSSTECKDFIYKVLGNLVSQSKDKGMNRSKSRYSVLEDIYVIGGKRNGERPVDSVLKYNIRVSEWSGIEYMDEPLRSFGATVVDNNIYTVGGRTSNDSITCVVQMFNRDVNKWSNVLPLNVYRYALGVCSISNKIYACGGKDSQDKCTDSVMFCDLDVGCWKTVTPMNEKRGNVKIVCMEGSIWAIGGTSQYVSLRSVEQYDPREGWWAQTSMLVGRNNHDAVVFDNKIYVSGDDSFEEYDPRNKKWRWLSPMLHERSHAALVVSGGKIWSIGGVGQATVEVYDRCKNEWTLETPLPWILSEHCAVALPSN